MGTLTARMFNALGARDVEEGCVIPCSVDVLNHSTSEIAHTLSARNDMQCGSVLTVHGTQDPDIRIDHAHTLGRNQGRENAVFGIPVAPAIAHTLRGEGFNASEDGTGRGTPIVPVYGIPGNWIGRKPENGGNAVEPMVNVAPCQTGADRHAVSAGVAVRRLTPTECERLQGFPDGYTDIRPNGKATPDGPRYKALGNSMAVNCMRWIGERIQLVEDIHNDLQM